MWKTMLVVLLASTVARGQDRTKRALADAGYMTSGFYVQIGYAHGPSFDSFFDYLEDTYQTAEEIRDFDGNVVASIGYLSRLHRHIAIDVGFSIYGMRRDFEFQNNNGNRPESRIRHEINYQSAIFSGTLPLVLEFEPGQPVVPYIGVGLSIFSLRIDNYRDAFYAGSPPLSEALRDTRTTAGGHFEGGVAFKLSRKLWIDARGRWHAGISHLVTLEDFPHDFEVRQNVSQFSLGIDYFFR
jgi:hypothetical protein